ncbi:hypothetical protein KAR91_29795 [Candidatus Pacearchaeota archaeon]|nr:hypothetical protein [Candidatus Pacearchaeota archaeon]
MADKPKKPQPRPVPPQKPQREQPVPQPQRGDPTPNKLPAHVEPSEPWPRR